MLRNYIYLDREKIYSLLFQFHNNYSNTEFISDFPQSIQNGNNNSTSNIDDKINPNKINTKNNFLHERAFAELERNISELGIMIDISDKNPLSENNSDFSFARIKLTGMIFDPNKYIDYISDYNEIAKSLVISSNANEIFHLKNKVNEYKNSQQDRNLITQFENKIQYLSNADKIIKDLNLYKDESLLKSFSKLASVFCTDLIEITQNDGHINYTSLLKKKNLLEPEESLIRKYANITDKYITIFGIISQKKSNTNNNEYKKIGENTISNMIKPIIELENKIYSLDNYLIDPIAVYIEL